MTANTLTLRTDLQSNVDILRGEIDTLQNTAVTFKGTKTFQDDLILEANIRVNGDLMVANTINMIVSDPIMELGANNLNTNDLGIVMTRHGNNSNVAVFYDESEDTFNIGYTNNNAYDSTLTIEPGNPITMNVHGTIEASSFVGDGSLLSNIGTSSLDTNRTLNFSNITTGFTVDSNIVISGNVTAGTFLGDGGLLSNIAATLQEVTDNGNTTTNTLQFINTNTAFVTDLTSNVGLKLNQLSNITITNPLQADHLLVYDGSNWINDYNLHNFIKVHNNTGDTLYRGNAVYIVDSFNNNVANVALAKSDSSSTMPAIGLIHEDVAPGEEGVAVAYGKVNGINTLGYMEGQTVYVSNTSAGNIMNTKPYGLADQIQNVGICIRAHENNGVVFVTGVGRSNDIPNAPISSSPNYVYVNETNNDMKKIAPVNLLTKLQTLAQVVNTGNTVANTINVTGLTTIGNVNVGSNISVDGLTMGYIPITGSGNYLVDSNIQSDNGNVVISTDTQINGNLYVTGSTVFNSYMQVAREINRVSSSGDVVLLLTPNADGNRMSGTICGMDSTDDTQRRSGTLKLDVIVNTNSQIGGPNPSTQETFSFIKHAIINLSSTYTPVTCDYNGKNWFAIRIQGDSQEDPWYSWFSGLLQHTGGDDTLSIVSNDGVNVTNVVDFTRKETIQHTEFSNQNLVVSYGNVGIGTTSPSAKLHIDNGVLVVEDTPETSTILLLPDGDGTGGSLNVHNIGNTHIGVAQFVSEQEANTSTIAIINKDRDNNTTKNASIGFYNTDTVGTGKYAGKIGFWPDNGNAQTNEFRVYTTDTTAGYDYPQQRFVINKDGNVGIGTTSPLSILHVRGSGQTNTTSFDTSQTLGASIFAESSDSVVGSGGSLVFGTHQGKFAAIKAGILDGSSNTMGNLHIMTRNATADATLTNKMTITNTGNIGIGTNTPIAKLDVRGDIYSPGVICQTQQYEYSSTGVIFVTSGTTTLLSCPFTPKFSNSKILVQLSIPVQTNSVSFNIFVNRNTSRITSNPGGSGIISYSSGTDLAGHLIHTGVGYDVPNTTSQITYDIVAEYVSGDVLTILTQTNKLIVFIHELCQ
jgi:hypothetical protein